MDLKTALAQAVQDVRATRYSELASSIIIVYEHLLTLDDEVQLVWHSPWSFGKILYIANRYFGLFATIPWGTTESTIMVFSLLLSLNLCRTFFQWQGWTGLVACMIAEMILQMRLYALYYFNTRILATMMLGYVLASAASATVIGLVLSKITVHPVLLPAVGPFCVPLKLPHYYYAFWIPTLIFESFLCGMALFRGFQTHRAAGPLFQSGRGLATILIRDSGLYFLCMFATYFTNLMVWSLGRESLIEIPIGFSVAMSCVLANRIALNIRRTALEMKNSARHVDSRADLVYSTGVGSAHGSEPDQRVTFVDRDVRPRLTDAEMTRLRQMRPQQYVYAI